MSENVLQIRFLGDFSLIYNGIPVPLERNSGTKAAQLLEYLLYHHGESISRDKLIQILYADDMVSNPQNNLKVNIFRLRKLLAASHLPEHEYIVHQNSSYSWRSEIPVELDTDLFTQACREGMDFRKSTEHRCQWLLKAVELYTGEFLPLISSEPWVAVEAVKYTNMYVSCVQNAFSLLEAAGEYDKALELCQSALKRCPYEEDFHLKRISILVESQRYTEALSAYDEASRTFLENLGISPSAQMLELYRRITGNARHSTALIDEIKTSLRQNSPASGAYYCNFPGFMDSYLLISRLAERNGQSIFLMLSTLTDVHGVPLDLGDKLTAAAEALHSAIQGSLRRSDLFTRYSPCQFLMLLIGTNRENCDIVAERLSAKFKELCDVRGVRVQHSFASGLSPETSQHADLKFGSSGWNL